MFFYNSKRSLFESAGEVLSSAELLDKDESQEVKQVIDDLEDALTTNVEEVPAKDKVSTGATDMLEPKTESVMLYETEQGSGKYFVNLFDIVRLCEAEEEAAEEAGEEVPEVDAAEKAEEIADVNDGVDADDLVIVAPVDTAEEIVQNAANEAAVGIKNGKAMRRLRITNECVKSLRWSRMNFQVLK